MESKQKTQVNMILTETLMKQSVSTYVLSRKYINVIVNASLFNIMYRRLPIPEEEFKSRKFEDIPFVVAKNKGKSLKDQRLISFIAAIKGITDAIFKKYLKTVFLILKNSDDDILETYSISLKYNDNHVQENRGSSDHVKEATKLLLQAVNNLGKMKKLDEDTKFDLEFTYNDNTPMDYEPPCFQQAVNPYCLVLTPHVRLSTINTGFHKLVARSSVVEIPMTPVSSIFTQDVVELSSYSDDTRVIKISDDERLVEKNREIMDMDNNTDLLSENTLGSFDKMEVNCICEMNFVDNFVTIIQCILCKKMYHKPCSGFIHPSADCSNFECYHCNRKQDICLDSLETYNHVQLLAQIRLIVYFLLIENNVPSEIIDRSDKDKKKLLRNLKNFGIYSSTIEDMYDYSKYDLQKAKEVVTDLFRNSENSEF